MLTVLAAQWKLTLFRGAVALLFGLLAVAWPNLTPAVLAVLFGSYALLNGIAALMIAVTSRSVPGFGGVFVEGIVGIATGTVASLYPGITTFVLVAVIAAWAVITGVASIVTAIFLRNEMSGEWPLPFTGALSLMLGALLLLQLDAGVLAIRWMVTSYAVFAGASQLALASRLRQLAREIAQA
jgi:uncharacterized membrane protein HdeD (DUF308 family)